MKFKDVYDDICEFKSKPEGKDLEGVECLEFFGLADAEVSYHLVGRIHSLPDQEGIPGWQKVSMVKFMPDQEDGHHGPGKTVAWAYEGVVLPGNQIMVGRWYEPSNDYCGPFIFWRTSSQEGDEKLETENEEAVNFLQTIEENLGYVSYV